MKQITKKSIGVYITFAILIVFLTGAQCSVGGCTVNFGDFTGKAVNVKSAKSDSFYKDQTSDLSLYGADVILYAYDAETGAYETSAYSTEKVDENGNFSFFSVEPNRYKMTGEHTGWTFVPRFIEINGSDAALPDLLAYPTDDAGLYTIIASWEDPTIDVDLTLTFGPDNIANTVYWTPDFNYLDNTKRYRIQYDAAGNIHHGDAAQVILDRDVTYTDALTIPRVETISINHFGWFEYLDTIRVYLDTPYSDQVLTGDSTKVEPSAYAQVDLMEGNTHYGTWYIPWNTAESSLQIIDMTYNGTIMSTIASANNAGTLYSGIKSIIWEN